MRDLWTTQGTRTWIIPKCGEPELHTYCALESLKVSLDGHKGTWICRYCNGVVSGESKCPQCNAPKHTRNRGCTALVCGWLPHAIALDELEDDFTIEVIHSKYGDPGDYFFGEVVVRIEHCKVADKWIPELDFIGDSDYTGIALHVEIEGQASFMPKERAWER